MTYEDIVALAKAGFTASQIAEMAKTAPEQATPPQTAPAQATPTQTTPAQETPTQTTPAQATPTQTAPAQATVGIDAVLAQIKTLTEAVQANGIINSNQPPKRTADDILAEIINPNINK